MKKLLSFMLVLVMMLGFTACNSGNKAGGKKVKLTMMTHFQSSENVTAELEAAIAGFMKENSNIEVELIPGTSEYEPLMKSKMASNDLPDLWTTHGWSVLRYSEYLTEIENEPWVKDLHPAIRPVITSKEGHIYVLPMDVDVAGIAYNKEVVAQAGVDVTTIKTWGQLFEAMDKVKAMGITPVHIGGKDNWTVGNFFDWVAPAIFITDENNYSGEELKTGTFDTDKWKVAAELMKTLKDKEYINVDVLTSTYPDSARALGEGQAAFEFYGNAVLSEAWTYNPDAKLGFFPVPAYYKGDQPSLISGERTTIGIWKDTEHPEEAKALLTYFAKPEVMKKVASANRIPAGLVNVDSDTGKLSDSYEQWKDTEAFPYFDREFLPSGMWDTMCSTGTGLLADDMSAQDAANKMLEDYKKLYTE